LQAWVAELAMVAVVAAAAITAVAVVAEAALHLTVQDTNVLFTNHKLFRRRSKMNETANAKQQINRGTETIRNQFDDVKSRFNDVRDQAKYYTDEVTQMVEEHPMYAILGATVVGFALGALFARR